MYMRYHLSIAESGNSVTFFAQFSTGLHLLITYCDVFHRVVQQSSLAPLFRSSAVDILHPVPAQAKTQHGAAAATQSIQCRSRL